MATYSLDLLGGNITRQISQRDFDCLMFNVQCDDIQILSIEKLTQELTYIYVCIGHLSHTFDRQCRHSVMGQFYLS